MATLKIIAVEWRKPKTKKEKQCYGITTTEGELSKIFIHEALDGTKEEVETFFHEITHAYLHHHNCPLTEKQQERLADAVGRAAKGLLC